MGQVFIHAPPGATGYGVFTNAPSSAISAPVTGVPTARLTAWFRAGDVPGDYVVRYALNGGNVVDMHVAVN